MGFSSPLVLLWKERGETIVTNRDRVLRDIDQTTMEVVKQSVPPEAFTNTVLCGIMVELAGLNDELHALNLKIDKLTKEVGKRK